jgi:hypothetical protein
MIRAEIGLKNRQIINETYKFVRRHIFVIVYPRQNPEENIILIGPGQYTKILTVCANKDKNGKSASE